MPKVSVLLPSYNHAKWISECIESILNQTFSNFELIIVDDGSSDNSAEIIKKYAKKDNRIKFEILSKNKGAAFALVVAYNLSRGEYIAVTSSDDVWKLDKLEKQTKILDERKDLGALFGMPEFINAESKKIQLLYHEFLPSLEIKNRKEWLNFFFNRGNCLCHPTILIRTECYKTIGGFLKLTLRSLPDFELWTRLCYHYDIMVMNDVLVQFRKHSFNESKECMTNTIRGMFEHKQILYNFLYQIKTIKELKDIFPEFIDTFKVDNDVLVPFYLAQIALKRHDRFATDFAFDVLYKEMEKPEVLKLIQDNDLYSLVQLSNDIVKANIYQYITFNTLIKEGFILLKKKVKKALFLFNNIFARIKYRYNI